MGMNFYAYTGKKTRKECPTCGHKHTELEKVHIGKSSFGRYFTLHIDEDRGLTDLATWKAFLEAILAKGGKIVDEDENECTLEDMVATITRDKSKYKSFSVKHKVGEKANEFGDVYGERGFIYNSRRIPAADGLYVTLQGEFC